MSSDVSFPRDNERRGGDVAAKTCEERIQAVQDYWREKLIAETKLTSRYAGALREIAEYGEERSFQIHAYQMARMARAALGAKA